MSRLPLLLLLALVGCSKAFECDSDEPSCNGVDDTERTDDTGDSICPDTDDDRVCDDIDQCVGDDFSGDDDGDDVCNDIDLCTGDDLSGDADSDGLCDNLDACIGGDASADADNDGVCDFLDLCEGDDRRGDGDVDGICGDLDQCDGDDKVGDDDEDGVCNDRDACAGDDREGDIDEDQLCDDTDLCLGPNESGDVDADALCDDWDICVATETEVLVLSLNVVECTDEVGGNGDLELYGRIWAQMGGEEDVTLWQASRSNAISIEEDHSWPNGGALAVARVPALVTDGPNMVIRTELWDKDTWNSDDAFPVADLIWNAEDGCARAATVNLTGPGDERVSVDFRVRPAPID